MSATTSIFSTAKASLALLAIQSSWTNGLAQQPQIGHLVGHLMLHDQLVLRVDAELDIVANDRSLPTADGHTCTCSAGASVARLSAVSETCDSSLFFSCCSISPSRARRPFSASSFSRSSSAVGLATSFSSSSASSSSSRYLSIFSSSPLICRCDPCCSPLGTCSRQSPPAPRQT